MASLQRPMLVIPHDAPETVADLSPDVRLRETKRLREAGWRLMTRGMQMVRTADAPEDGLAGSAVEIVRCIACGMAFPLWHAEREWFESKRDDTTGEKWSAPKPCQDCRAVRRVMRRQHAKARGRDGLSADQRAQPKPPRVGDPGPFVASGLATELRTLG